LRFELCNMAGGHFWDVALAGNDSVISMIVPLHVSLPESCDSSSAPDDEGNFFVQEWSPEARSTLLFAQQNGLWREHFAIGKVTGAPDQLYAISLDSRSGKLFGICGSGSPEKLALPIDTELLWFDPASRDFRLFLPGISANDVDFSPDGRQIAYVHLPERTLWVSRADGSDAREITPPSENVELPRWSPDGKRIAFMDELPGKPWRIFVVPAGGGKYSQASVGSDNQGAPTWSPDGKWLAYSNVSCEESDSCAIHRIDLATSQELVIPGSDGMELARWSPDGRYVAALKTKRQELYLFDFRNQHWRKLADGINSDDLRWSTDSRYIFGNVPNNPDPRIIGVSLHGNVKTAVDLSILSKLPGRMDTWFTVGPGGSFLMSHWIRPSEIYTLSYR
jgi:WD40-like Beta Propeller Repeat